MLRGQEDELSGGGQVRQKRRRLFGFLGGPSCNSSEGQQKQTEHVTVEESQGAWDVCNTRGVTLDELEHLNPGKWMQGY